MNKSLKELATMSENDFTDWLCTDHSEPIYTEKDKEDEYRMDAQQNAMECDPNYQEYLENKESKED